MEIARITSCPLQIPVRLEITATPRQTSRTMCVRGGGTRRRTARARHEFDRPGSPLWRWESARMGRRARVTRLGVAHRGVRDETAHGGEHRGFGR